jgi:AcrR family transcriptional regulator
VLGTPNIDRQARRREATRREILEAAWALVRDQGWDGLTLRAVAERVGMRAPSLYGHFDSKLAIVDAMFAQAWEEFDAETAHLASHLSGDPRQDLHDVASRVFDAMVVRPERYGLMHQRPVPGFTPSPEAFAPSVRSLGRFQSFLHDHGIDDQEAVDLYTALLTGLTSQQISNDPGGTRWRRLLPRAIDMYADAIGVPHSHDTTDR